MPNSTTISGSNGVKKLENLFKKANRVYIKGGETTDFIGVLDMKKVMEEICCEIKPLCKELGVKCSGKLCKRNGSIKAKRG